jgi:hypothetical protein
MDPREINRRSAVTESVIRDLEGAGLLSHPKVNRQAIIDGLLRGDGDSNDVKQYQLLQHYTNPDTELKGHEDAIYGIPPEELRNFAHRDFQGRGWSEQEQQQLGRDVQNRELSTGSRQAQEWQRRRSLTEALLDSSKATAGGGNYNYGSPSGPMRTAAYTADENKLIQQDNATAEFDRTRGQKFGESGYYGMLENPEYVIGDVFTSLLDPMSAYAKYRAHEGKSGEDAHSLARKRTLAAQMSNAHALKIPRRLDTSTPQKKDRSYQQVKGIYQGLAPKSYDNAVRQARKDDQYPSYAASTLAEGIGNMADPGTLLAAGGGWKHMLKELLTEDVPTYAGISGLFGAWENIPKKWGTPGNEARTDLYNPATGKPETTEEFSTKINQWQADRDNALRNYQTYEGYGRPLMTR